MREMVLLRRKSLSCGEGFHSKGSAWFLARIISLDIKNLSLRSSICFFDFFSYTELLRDICPSCRSIMETMLLEMANLRLRG